MAIVRAPRTKIAPQYIRFQVPSGMSIAAPQAMQGPHVFPSEHGHHVRVLIVEDEDVSRRALRILLEMSGYPAQAVASAEGALAEINRGALPSVALVDLDLPGMNGVELIEKLRKSNPAIRSILITAADAERVRQLMHGRRVPHLRKPIDFKNLLGMLGGNGHSSSRHLQ